MLNSLWNINFYLKKEVAKMTQFFLNGKDISVQSQTKLYNTKLLMKYSYFLFYNIYGNDSTYMTVKITKNKIKKLIFLFIGNSNHLQCHEQKVCN